MLLYVHKSQLLFMENPKPHILLLASPGMGHLIPLLELSKRLAGLNTLRVTLFVVSTDTSTMQSQLLKTSSKFHSDLHIVDLTPLNILDIMSSNEAVETLLAIIMRDSIAALRSHITCMESLPAALIVDIFGIDSFDMVDEMGIPKYVFVTTSAWFVALTVYVRILDQEVEGEYLDLTEPIQIPGCKPIRPEDTVDPMSDRKIQRYREYLNLSARLAAADGLLLNTWEDLEPQSLEGLRENKILRKIMKPRVYPIGPVVRNVEPEETMVHECLDWLTKQPSESVLYVSFGSGGTLSHEQMTELAWGLELSQQRFVWLVRPPTRSDASGAFFKTGMFEDPSEYLPEGFLTRTHKQGIVVSKWVPQEYILAHPAIGGFLSHCGWNSMLESITNGVPMIAWPLYAEQRMNAAILVEVLGVAVRSEVLPSKRVVSREEIEKMATLVIGSKEGEVMRDKVRDIKNGALKAIGKDGSSYNSLLEMGKEWEMKNQSRQM